MVLQIEMISAILDEEMRLREIKWFTQGHIAN